jgi:FlgN protein
MGVHELSTLLWRERELLELLMFKLEEEQLLLTAGKSKWLPFATREVEQVLERLRQSGLERAVEVSAVALEWGTNEDATLREIIAHAPSGAWAENFTSHLRALTELASSIAGLRDSNLQYLRAASRSTQETLAHLNTESGTYDARGSNGSSPAPAHMFDTEA